MAPANLYFCLIKPGMFIFGYHVIAVVLPLAYNPCILTSVLAHIHLIGFIALVINFICID